MTAPLPPSPAAPADTQTRRTLVTLTLEVLAVLLLVAGGRTAYVLRYAKADSNAEAIAAAIAPVILATIVLGIFYALGHARTRRSRATILCTTLALFFLGESVQYGSARARQDLTDPERRGLAIEGREIRHRSFHFALPYPGAEFRFNARIGEAAKRQEADMTNVMTWVLSDSLESRLIFVQAAKGLGGDRDNFARFTGGIRKSLDHADATVKQDSLEWTDARHEYRLAARLANGVELHERCIPSPAGAPVTLVACVTTLSDNMTAMAFVVEGLQFSR